MTHQKANCRKCRCLDPEAVTDYELQDVLPFPQRATHDLACSLPHEHQSILPLGERNQVATEEFVTWFLRWAQSHSLACDWMVDDIWFLVCEDFAPAQDLRPPPRRVFLGQLKRQAGVVVAKDKRVYDRQGRAVRKTTIYSLPSYQSTASGLLPRQQRAACAA
ncbi:MAG: hypothetical protein JXQ99_04520 [Hyphomicrobiaceae bacterium]